MSASSTASSSADSSGEACKKVSTSKSTGHGIFINNVQSSSSLPSNVIPLNAFTDAPLFLVNDEGKYDKDDHSTFNDILSDQGNIILVVRRPG